MKKHERSHSSEELARAGVSLDSPPPSYKQQSQQQQQQPPPPQQHHHHHAPPPPPSPSPPLSCGCNCSCMSPPLSPCGMSSSHQSMSSRLSTISPASMAAICPHQMSQRSPPPMMSSPCSQRGDNGYSCSRSYPVSPKWSSSCGSSCGMKPLKHGISQRS